MLPGLNSTTQLLLETREAAILQTLQRQSNNAAKVVKKSGTSSFISVTCPQWHFSSAKLLYSRALLHYRLFPSEEPVVLCKALCQCRTLRFHLNISVIWWLNTRPCCQVFRFVFLVFALVLNQLKESEKKSSVIKNQPLAETGYNHIPAKLGCCKLSSWKRNTLKSKLKKKKKKWI